MQKRRTIYTREWTRLWTLLGIHGENASCREVRRAAPQPRAIVLFFLVTRCNSPIQSLPLLQRMKRTASNQSISLPGMSLGALGTALGPCVPGCLTDHIFSFQGWLSLTASSCEMWSSSNPILKQADLLRTSTKNGTRLLTLWDPRCLFPVTNPHFPQIPPFLHVSTEEGNRGENWDQLLRCDQVRNL